MLLLEPGKLARRQMILFSMFFACAMSVRRVILQFGGALVILVMGSVVVSSGH